MGSIGWVVGNVLTVLAGLGVAAQIEGVAAQTSATVTVAATSPVAPLLATSFGLNTAVWDGNLLDASIPAALRAAGITALRFPGGSTSDVYNWQTNAIVTGQSGYANPANTFDAFMGVAKASGATPIVTVNYGSNVAGDAGGSPAFAAAWVQYSNVVKKYGVKYWEIGNEVYGNGVYGSAWETDLHAAHDPATYGANVAQFVAAMKRVDPTIKIGVVLTAPGAWPDGKAPDWNTNVLAQCGSLIDFVIVHWYPQNPGSESDAGLLAAPQTGGAGSLGIAEMTAKLRSLVRQYGGSNPSRIQLFVTETNSVSFNPGKQTVSVVNALFLADTLMTWFENGAANVDLWDLHNGSNGGNASPALYGSTSYGDYGILSNGTSGEPAAGTPFPSDAALQMLSKLGGAGGEAVATSSSNAQLATHAVLQANNTLALLLVNKDPANTTTARISVAGYKPASTGTLYTYGEAGGPIAASTATGLGSSFALALPPYSLTTLVLNPASGTSPSPAFALAATPSSASVAPGGSAAMSVAVTPSGGFASPVTFAVNGLPSGVSASFSPPTVTPPAGTTLTFSASKTAAASTAAMTITGTSTGTGTSGTRSANTLVSLVVTSPGQGGGGGGGGSGGGSGGTNGPASVSGKVSASSPWFDQEEVDLVNSAPITALTLTIKVAASNVTYSSLYQTVGAQVTGSHTDGTAITVTFALAVGQSINAGSYSFVAQLQGNGTQHATGGDSWSVTYTTGGKTYTQSGYM